MIEPTTTTLGKMPKMRPAQEPPIVVSSLAEGSPTRTVHAASPGTTPVTPPKAKPQRAASQPKSRWWLQLIVLAILGAGAYYAYPRIKPLLTANRAPTVAPPPRIIPVVTAVVQHADMGLYLNGLGTVTGFRTVTVRSRVEGELMKIAFTEGQMVAEGDLIAEIDPRSYQVQLREAEAQLLKDKAALRLAILDYQRYEGLVGSKTVTQQQLDTQKVLVQQAQATLQTDQGQIDNAKLLLSYCRITAPISGRLGLRTVDAGNMVRANDPMGLAVITQLQPISVVFTIPQDDIARVQLKMNGPEPLVVDAFDRSFETKLATGTLAAIDNQVDSTTGTVRLKAVFQNEQNLLFPNQFVNARLLVETLHDAVIVPSAAVQRGPDSPFAYVVKADSTVDLRKVTTGPAEADLTVIESGLAAGEVVVIDGVDKLQKGAKVAVRGEESKGKEAGAEPPTKKPEASEGTSPKGN